MDVQIITVLLGLSGLIGRCFARDCQHEIQFQSNLSVQSWCMTNSYECSLGSLRANPNVSSLYDVSEWQAPEPVDFRVTSYCQTDEKGDNRAGVRFSWKPPADKGASCIKGFQISLEGNLPGPGYRCIVLKLRENLTQFVVDNEISGSIYPVRRNQIFVLVLYSLPWSTDSVNLYRRFHTSECHNAIAVSSKWDTNLTTIYDEEHKTLNVSFPGPPEQFNLTQFVLTILSLNSSVIIPKVRINKTFHVFSSIELGSYVLYLEPYNPHPFEHDLCRCRDDRNRCATCKMSQGFVFLGRGSPRTTVSYNRNGRRKWTTKGFRFRNRKWRRKGQNADGRDVRVVKQNGGNRLLIRVVLPLVLLLFSGLCVTILLVYVFRRRRQPGSCCKATGSINDQSPMITVGNDTTKRRCLTLLDVSNSDKHEDCTSVQSELIDIVKGMLGDAIDIRKLTHSRGSPNHLRESLRRVIKDCVLSSNNSSIEHDCSETSLIESKQSSDLDLKTDCYLEDTEDNVGVLLLVFIDSGISADDLASIRRVCDAVFNGVIDYDMVCVSRSKSDRAYNDVGAPVFAYKEELSALLNFVNCVLAKQDFVNITNKNTLNAGMTQASICTVNQTTRDIDDQSVELRNAKGTGGQWIEWPEGVDMAQGQWIDSAARRKRYVSSDSGWGASENSFRSTPIGEVSEASDNSSVQSIPGTEHEELSSAVRPEFVNTNECISSSASTTLVRPRPVAIAIDSSTCLCKCPSDFSFFPPEDFMEPEAETICIDDFVGMSNLSDLETVSCSTCESLNRKDKTISDGRHSPSMDSLMEMMRAINDESKFYVINEVEESDMFNVVFEAVV